jgi:hypothetical protein
MNKSNNCFPFKLSINSFSLERLYILQSYLHLVDALFNWIYIILNLALKLLFRLRRWRYYLKLVNNAVVGLFKKDWWFLFKNIAAFRFKWFNRMNLFIFLRNHQGLALQLPFRTIFLKYVGLFAFYFSLRILNLMWLHFI